MSLPLPGTLLSLVGCRLASPYSIREDETKLYLCFGSEEVTREFDHAVDIVEVEEVIRIDRARRSAWDFFRREYGLPA